MGTIRTTALGMLAGAGVLFASGEATAHERVSAADCFIDTDHIGDYRWNGDGIANLSSGSGWRPRSVYCPIFVSDAYFPASTIQGLRLSFLDGNNQFGSVHNFHARVCRSSRSVQALSCSAWSEVNPGTATGVFTNTASAAIRDFLRNTTSSNYLTLFVTIPANNGWPSVFRGYEIVR